MGTALITPFNQGGKVCVNALSLLIEKQIAGGANFLVPCGTTGEAPTLSHDEHRRVIELVVEKVNKRVPVLAGTGSNSTEEAVELTRAAKQLGADGALVVSPYYNKPMQAGIADYYRQMAEVGLPVILYDIPGRCGGNGVSAETILKLAYEQAIVGLKWASGNFNQLEQVLDNAPENFAVLSGDDNLTFLAICLGAQGVISVLSNLVPKRLADFVATMIRGDIAAGRQLHFLLSPLMRAMFLETNPIPIKAAMAMVCEDVFLPDTRSPLSKMGENLRQNLAQALENFGIQIKPAASASFRLA